MSKINDVRVLNDFFNSEMRFLTMQLPEEELGPFKLVKDIELDEDLIFVTHSPELYGE